VDLVRPGEVGPHEAADDLLLGGGIGQGDGEGAAGDLAFGMWDEEQRAVRLLVDRHRVRSPQPGPVDPFLGQADDVRRAARDLDLPQFHRHRVGPPVGKG
jgi:hypothetical protein